MILISILLLALINSFVIIGFHESTQYKTKKVKGRTVFVYKMVLWRVSYYGNKILGTFWNKPFYACCTCMSSIHSTYVYFPIVYYTYGISWITIAFYPVYILLVAGIVTSLVNKIYA